MKQFFHAVGRQVFERTGHDGAAKEKLKRICHLPKQQNHQQRTRSVNRAIGAVQKALLTNFR